jgi:hypothetical protein
MRNPLSIVHPQFHFAQTLILWRMPRCITGVRMSRRRASRVSPLDPGKQIVCGTIRATCGLNCIILEKWGRV